MTQKKECFVGFDTSNYTTSAAFCDADGRVVANLKMPLTVKAGERGLRQSDAVFAHVKNLPTLMDLLREKLEGYTPVAVGVSVTPRMAEGSYMPCFLCGQAAARAFAASSDLPVFETAHQNGHIMAAVYSSGAQDRLFSGRFIAFHVSGGTTEALLVTPSSDDDGFSVELIGETRDINAGQAIDRIGVMMGLSFPCGAELERLAASYGGKIEQKKICVSDGCCSLSGIENIAKAIYEKDSDKAKTAAFTFDFLARTIEAMGVQLIEKYGRMPILFAGGVMSNMLMRERLSGAFEAYFSKPEFSADNAAGVALLCRKSAIKRGII